MNLVEVKDLKMHFRLKGRRKAFVKAVDGVSFAMTKGKSFGLVGESGCGKTTTARMIIRLYKPTSGNIIYDGKDITDDKIATEPAMRRNIQMVFQDPYASLHPRMTVSDTVLDPLVIHKIGTKEKRKQRLEELLTLVGLDHRYARRFPHEFSGGQRQRIGIARALALNPNLLILDEPVSALDVSVQSQILNLLQSLQEELGLTYLFISHNLSVVNYMCDEIAVMYLGRIVEQASRKELFQAPIHPYTQALLSAIPSTDIHEERPQKILLSGDIPSPANPPSGCSFHTRCNYASDICREQIPQPTDITATHKVFCWHQSQFII